MGLSKTYVRIYSRVCGYFGLVAFPVAAHVAGIKAALHKHLLGAVVTQIHVSDIGPLIPSISITDKPHTALTTQVFVQTQEPVSLCVYPRENPLHVREEPKSLCSARCHPTN